MSALNLTLNMNDQRQSRLAERACGNYIVHAVVHEDIASNRKAQASNCSANGAPEEEE